MAVWLFVFVCVCVCASVCVTWQFAGRRKWLKTWAGPRLSLGLHCRLHRYPTVTQVPLAAAAADWPSIMMRQRRTLWGSQALLLPAPLR